MTDDVGRNEPCPCGSGKKFKKCCIGRPIGPALELVEEKQSGNWKIHLRNIKPFEKALGRDVLNGFCRCFVQSDRLTSMFSFGYVSLKYHGRDSVAYGRDLHTMVWLTIGTLRELALAIKDVRSALAKRRRLDPKHPAWVKLRDFEKRWEDDEFYRRMRDKAAFHVDVDVVDKGLDELVKERDVVLCRGDGPKAVNASLTLGLEAVHNGLEMNLEAYGQFLRRVSKDHGIAGYIQQAFVEAAESAGIQVGDD